MAKKVVFQSIFALTLALLVMGCEYNYFESGGTLTVVNKTMVDYYVTVEGSSATLSPGSRKSWEFDTDTTAEFSYSPVGYSRSDRHTTDIGYGVQKVVTIKYED
jgi:hypothetical protein